MEIPLVTESDIRQRIWMELQRATQDRHHAWRTPVLATLGTDGWPQARTVVLRHADAKLGTLQIFTDKRSPKVAELIAKPESMLTFWSKRLNWQLRVCALTTVQLAGPAVDAVWVRVGQSAAAGDYLSERAPGDAMSGANAADTQNSGSAQTHHLAIVTAQVKEIDWLELSRSGHRRAVFSDQTWEWRVP